MISLFVVFFVVALIVSLLESLKEHWDEQEKRKRLAPPTLRVDSHCFQVESYHKVVRADLRVCGAEEPLVAISWQVWDSHRGEWENHGVIRTGRASLVARDIKRERDVGSCTWEVGYYGSEYCSLCVENAYALETWLREKVGAPQPAGSGGEAWTRAWRDLRASLKEVVDAELRLHMEDMVSVAYRDRLEQPQDFAAEEPAAVVRSVRAVIAEYQRIVGQFADAGADEAAALEHARNAAASACVLGVQRCFVPPPTKERDGT